jgi:hypothetical protein
MKAHLRYLRTVTRHKWFVFLECCKLRIFWRGLIHDWTKFLPSEWSPYVASFEGPKYPSYKGFHGEERRLALDLGHTKEAVRERFDRAWLHHQRWNKHHWQYWVLRNDDGSTVPQMMPWVYVREMVADWRGAGRAYGSPDTAAWYLARRASILLHPATRALVEALLGLTPKEEGL